MDSIDDYNYYGKNFIIRIHNDFLEALYIMDKKSYLTMWDDGKKFVNQSNCRHASIMANHAYPDFVLMSSVFDKNAKNLIDFQDLMEKFHTAFQIMCGVPYLEFCNQLRSIVIECRERRSNKWNFMRQ